MNITTFWDVTPGKVVDKYHSFYKLHVAITQKTKMLPRAKHVLFLDVPSPMKPGAQWQEKLPAFFSTHICEQAPK